MLLFSRASIFNYLSLPKCFKKGRQNAQKSKLRKTRELDGQVQNDSGSKRFILLGLYVRLHLNIKMSEENTIRALYFGQ